MKISHIETSSYYRMKEYVRPYSDETYSRVRKDVNVEEDQSPPLPPVSSFERYNIRDYELLEFDDKLELKKKLRGE